MSIKDGPHFLVSAAALATWIEKQGQDRWWSVDGDPYLTGRITFPCPGDELAAELRKVNRKLLVQDKQKRPEAKGQEIDSAALDSVVDRLGNNVQISGEKKPSWLSDRLLYLSWENGRDEWLLVEDEETSESSQRDFAQAKQKD